MDDKVAGVKGLGEIMKYNELRETYKEFIYHEYNIEETEEKVKVTYHFEIAGLSEFHPYWEFPKNEKCKQQFAGNIMFENMVFSLGMVELVSYWKITCAPKVRVQAGALSKEQTDWWKELYFHGLGEFYYTNGIQVQQDDFMEIISEGEGLEQYPEENRELSGCLVPIGGGKDSAVTLSLLKEQKDSNYCYIINPRGATIHTVEAGGYEKEKMIAVKRTLDKNMIELNKQGFLNGHTPFSAIVAFSATIAAYMNGLKYIVLSNESSANESTVEGSTVNHQYSKSFKFEQDFHNYEKQYINSGTYYFSMLRPLSEFQIAKEFAKNEEYHDIFRSCNVGSKEDIWCGHCPKCLFVYFILSPFMEQERLTEIFGADMLNDTTMQETMKQLIGLVKEKPFECVGSRDEINTAICLTIEKLEQAGKSLPELLQYYKTEGLYEKHKGNEKTYLEFYDKEHLLPKEFDDILKAKCYD